MSLAATHMGQPIDPAENIRGSATVKAYLFYDDNGCSYDAYDTWVKAVFLVPLGFNPDEDALGFYHRLKKAYPKWFCKDRTLKAAYLAKGNAAYEADLRARFQSIPFLPVPWQLQS